MVTSERPAPRFLMYVGCALLIWVLTSCSNSKTTHPSGFGFVSPAASPTIDLGESINLTVNQSANWTLQSGCLVGPLAGNFTGGATTATGTTATYVAPTSLPQGPQSGQTCPVVVVVATTSDNQTATITVQLVGPPTISNASSFSYTGTGCNGVPCCPPSGTIIFPPTSNVTSLMQVGSFESLGPIFASTGTGVPPYTWQLVSGSGALPQGLSISPGNDSSQILITGTPISAGCSSFTLQLSDSTAGSNCNPQTSGACTQASFNVVVVPASPKVQVPAYPSAFNDPQNGNRGVPYPPIALQASGTQPPYFWCEAPPVSGGQGSTLPPGLGLNTVQQPNFDCPSVISNNTGVAIISGITSTGNDQNQNFFCSGNQTGAGCYSTQFQVYDSQSPYPGVSLVSLKNMEDLPLVSCSQANQAPFLNQAQLNPDSYLTGPVAFLLKGFDANGPVVMAGSVTLDGAGNATGGTVDVTRSSGHRQLAVQKGAGSWYIVGTSAYGVGEFGIGGLNVFDYSRGCMNLSLADSGGSVPPISFSFSLGGCTNHFTQAQVTSTSLQACGFNNNQPLGTFTTGRMIEFDDNTGSGTRASGILRVQDSSSFSSGLSGPYAFGLSGGDSVEKRYAVAGSFQANSGSLVSLAADIDDGGTCGGNSTCNVNTTGGSGTYTADTNFGSSNGRWSGTLSVSSQNNFGVAIYAVSASEALVATTDQLAVGHPIVGGEAIATSSSFGPASLQNSHMFHIGGLAPNVGPDVSIGILNFDGNGSITSGTVYQDQAATLGTTQVSGVYQVDPNTGRAVFSAPQQGQTLGAHPFVAYLIPPPATLSRTNCSSPAACVTGFIVGTDNTAQSGILEFQTSATAPPPPFINLYITGNYAYGTDESQDSLSTNLEGDVFASPTSASTTGGTLGSGTNPFIQDASYGDTNYYCPSSTCYLLQPNQFLNGSYTVTSNGTGTFGGGVVSVTNGNVTFSIDESPVNKHPSITVAEQ